MYRKPIPYLAVAMLAMGSGAASADCAGTIEVMEEALDEAALSSISDSTGGQGVAAAREARAMTDTEAPGDDAPIEGEETAAADDQAPGHGAPAEAGDRIQALRAAMDEARAQDEAACRETLVTAIREAVAPELEQAAP